MYLKINKHHILIVALWILKVNVSLELGQACARIVE